MNQHEPQDETRLIFFIGFAVFVGCMVATVMLGKWVIQ